MGCYFECRPLDLWHASLIYYAENRRESVEGATQNTWCACEQTWRALGRTWRSLQARNCEHWSRGGEEGSGARLRDCRRRRHRGCTRDLKVAPKHMPNREAGKVQIRYSVAG